MCLRLGPDSIDEEETGTAPRLNVDALKWQGEPLPSRPPS